MIQHRLENVDIKTLSEIGNINFKGTIIDFETFGPINNNFNDIRSYEEVKPTVLGFFDGKQIKQIFLLTKNFDKINKEIIPNLQKTEPPFYGFNTKFEVGIIYWQTNILRNFEYELQDKTIGIYGEKKEIVFQYLVRKNNHFSFLNIFEDPYNGEGYTAVKEWWKFVENPKDNKYFLERVLKHNRACLLKEWYILSHRKPFTAEELKIKR